MGEQIDIVSATGAHLRTADRHEVHHGGHWHDVFHCVVVRPDPPARVLLQRRHRAKKAFPGLLDLSATGHLAAGETPDDGVRELNEELGTDATAADLTYIGVRLLADDDGEGRNRERVHLYFAIDDRPIDAFSPAADEVESLVEVEVAPMLAAIDHVRSGVGRAPAVPAVEWRPGAAPLPTTIEAEDLIKPADGYWTVVLVMVDRFVRGDGPLAI
ncbi:MAG: NUDIX domain-containing protein [Actinomycetota bacterium]